MTHAPPTVSCLMPTRARHHLLEHAVRDFLAQDYLDAELLIVSEDGIPDALSEAIAGGRVRHVACAEGLTLGAKRNFAVDSARGELLVHWDDDDRSSPHRLSRQVQALQRPGVALCGSSRVHFRELESGVCYEYRYQGQRGPWVYGATLGYTREFWRRHPFESVTVGEDTVFVWAARPGEVLDLDDPSLCLCGMHASNTSPKHLNAWWKRLELPALGSELPAGPTLVVVPTPKATPSSRAAAPLRNVYACLVHERLDCVIDLVRQLRSLDADSRIVLYDGSVQGQLLDPRLPWARWGVELCPKPQPMAWGKLHGFALDCIRYLEAQSSSWDALTIVDSDQLPLRAGYPAYLAANLGARDGLGLLSSDPSRQGPATRIAPAMAAQQEIELWRPFLRRFAEGENKFAHWTFWPSTVLFRDACAALLQLFDKDKELRTILARSQLWATEEVLFPTLTALLGFRVERNPCSERYVKFRTPFSRREVDAALLNPSAFWMHPVSRVYADPTRSQIRQSHAERSQPALAASPPAGAHPQQIWPLLRAMRRIEGWLEDEEAELLAIATREMLSEPCDRRRVAVEIGSCCGKATYVLGSLLKASGADARLYAVDTFDGVVGAADRDLVRKGPTLEKFKSTLKQAGIEPWVEVVVGRAMDLRWDQCVDFLLIDGLHDYASIAQDFSAFEAHLAPDARVAFHDCAEYFPDVGRFVAELLASGLWTEQAQAGSLKLLQRRAAHPVGAREPSSGVLQRVG